MFSICHMNDDCWSIRNSRGEWWCGDEHEWVSPDSSYWTTDPDCWNKTFTAKEIKIFIKAMFSVKI